MQMRFVLYTRLGLNLGFVLNFTCCVGEKLFFPLITVDQIDDFHPQRTASMHVNCKCEIAFYAFFKFWIKLFQSNCSMSHKEI